MFCENVELGAVQKCAHLVDLEKCCQMYIHLQNFVLIQPRTSPPNFCNKLLVLLIRAAPPSLYLYRGRPAPRRARRTEPAATSRPPGARQVSGRPQAALSGLREETRVLSENGACSYLSNTERQSLTAPTFATPTSRFHPDLL